MNRKHKGDRLEAQLKSIGGSPKLRPAAAGIIVLARTHSVRQAFRRGIGLVKKISTLPPDTSGLTAPTSDPMLPREELSAARSHAIGIVEPGSLGEGLYTEQLCSFWISEYSARPLHGTTVFAEHLRKSFRLENIDDLFIQSMAVSLLLFFIKGPQTHLLTLEQRLHRPTSSFMAAMMKENPDLNSTFKIAWVVQPNISGLPAWVVMKLIRSRALVLISNKQLLFIFRARQATMYSRTWNERMSF